MYGFTNLKGAEDSQGGPQWNHLTGFPVTRFFVAINNKENKKQQCPYKMSLPSTNALVPPFTPNLDLLKRSDEFHGRKQKKTPKKQVRANKNAITVGSNDS